MVNQQQQTEALREHFRRLYAEGGKKFNLTDEKRYLAHALLQMMLYSSNQSCAILFETQKDCINDDPSAYVMSKESFVRWMNYNNINPHTRARIQPETFYFYNCHIEPNKFSNEDNTAFEEYKTQYEKAKSILYGLVEMDDSLPEEIKNAPLPLECLIEFVKNAETPEKIHNLLTKTSNQNTDVGHIAKKIVEQEEYKRKYENAEEGFLTNLKKFVIKCFLAIYEFVKFWFTVNSIPESLDNWRQNCQRLENAASKDFRDYLTKEITIKHLQDQSQTLQQ